MNQSLSKNNKGRLLALDILRGITIAGMILVNNPGSWGNIYAPLEHASWNGLTPTDLVFPFFMFIMGISTYFSLRKYDFRLSKDCIWKIVRRTVVIFLIGMFIAWFGLFLRGILGTKTFTEAVFCFDHIRILGVMPRLALCYGFGSVIALIVRPKALPWTVGALLVVYGIMLLFGDGFSHADTNIISIVDHKVLGPDHMYTSTVDGVTVKFDPEGLLSTLPAVVSAMFGMFTGEYLRSRSMPGSRIALHLAAAAVAIVLVGVIWSCWTPINKKLWSSSFTCVVTGYSLGMFALFYYLIDVRKWQRWTLFLRVIGLNSITIYLAQRIDGFGRMNSCAPMRNTLCASSISMAEQPDTQHAPMPRATTAAWEVIPPRTVRIP